MAANTKLYEAMFIVDSVKAREDYAQIEGVCLNAITRNGGEIVKAVKWDDRRLAYEINKVKRGTYILVHFNLDPLNVQKVDRQIQLNDQILRCLITVDEDGIETGTGAATPPPAEAK
ncbi:30S ribosomal protein S6 [Planctomycetales bacterium]|nr:30S ribosomal protein S6 [Planctomycetales bacterium]GHV21369.1 30S ribosomal protein S6 [Planctomycetales bacterium]